MASSTVANMINRPSTKTAPRSQYVLIVSMEWETTIKSAFSRRRTKAGASSLKACISYRGNFIDQIAIEFNRHG